MRFLFAACLLAACSSSPPELPPPPQLPQRAGVDPLVAARAAGVEFRATGPGFVLQIYGQDRITLDHNGQQLTFPKPRPLLPRWNGEIYETGNRGHQLRIEIRRLSCTSETGDT